MTLAVAGFVALGLATPPAMAESGLVVRDFVLSHGVLDREPVGPAESFRAGDDKAFAFARIENTGTPTTVSFVWHFGDEMHASVPVTVGKSSGWRTWSSARLRPGSWRVDLIDDTGAVLTGKSFIVGPKPAGPVALETDGMPAVPGAMGRP